MLHVNSASRLQHIVIYQTEQYFVFVRLLHSETWLSIERGENMAECGRYPALWAGINDIAVRVHRGAWAFGVTAVLLACARVVLLAALLLLSAFKKDAAVIPSM